MPCALAAALLPGSHAHGCRVQKTLFPGSALHESGRAREQGACKPAACALAAVDGGRRWFWGAKASCDLVGRSTRVYAGFGVQDALIVRLGWETHGGLVGRSAGSTRL